MGHNISSCDIVEGALYITDKHIETFTALGEGGKLANLPWYGEGSGRSEPILREFLALTAGTAAILLCWEGGESYTGLIVENGDVYEGEVTQTVRRKS